MNDKIQIFCENTGKYMDVKGGETLLDVYNRIKYEISVKPICAHVNHKTEGLNYPLFMPKMVNFIDEGNPSGQRMYVRSLCMVLAKAVHDLYPAASLCIEHSIASGYYATIDRQTADAATVAAVKRRMEEIIAADIPFVRSTKLTTDVIKLFRNAGMADKVTLLETAADLYTTYYSLEGFVDSYYGDLVPSTSYVGVFDLVPYESGLLLLPPDFDGDRTKPAGINPQPKLFKAFTDYIKLNKTVGVGRRRQEQRGHADCRGRDHPRQKNRSHRRPDHRTFPTGRRARGAGGRTVVVGQNDHNQTPVHPSACQSGAPADDFTRQLFRRP